MLFGLHDECYTMKYIFENNIIHTWRSIQLKYTTDWVQVITVISDSVYLSDMLILMLHLDKSYT